MPPSQAIADDIRTIFEATPVPMVVSTPDGRFEYVNPALLTMLGYSREEIYHPDVVVSHPEDRALNTVIRQQLVDHPNRPVVIEKRYIHKDGSMISGLLTLGAQRNASGNIIRFIGQIVDLSDLKKTQDELELFHTLVRNSNDGLYIIDPLDGRILDCNQQAALALGFSVDELLKLRVTDFVLNFNTEQAWQQHSKEIQRQKLMIVDGIHLRRNGTTFPVETSLSFVSQSQHDYIVAFARDVSDRKKSEELIWRQANFDSLTELPNRRLLIERLNHAMTKAARENKMVALLSVDLDHFKDVNDTLGHAVGDVLLQNAANRIRSSVRYCDTVARMGGDEFVIVLDQLDGTECIERVAQTLISELAQPFHLNLNKVYVSASVGISVYPADGRDSKQLLVHADQAMYAAKSEGKNRYHFFTPALQKMAETQSWISQALREALAKNQFSLVYQPVLNLFNGSCIGAEALLRWHHPIKGQIAPADFIPIAEINGNIEAIGAWVFEQATKQLSSWQKDFNPHFKVSINTSPLQFRGSISRFDSWQHSLSEANIHRETLVIEITENAMMDVNFGADEKLLLLRDLGIQVAIDDFGTGYSSLAYLRKFDIDYLKIDQSFVRKLGQDGNDLILCEAIVAMAHKLGLSVIAEGIETEQQANILKSIGCDYGQGFYFGKPATHDHFEQHYFTASDPTQHLA